MALEKELEYFNKIRGDLLKKDENKFALVKGEELLNTYTTWEEAYSAGVEKFGKEPFLIKQVLKEEPKENIPALSLEIIRATT